MPCFSNDFTIGRVFWRGSIIARDGNDGTRWLQAHRLANVWTQIAALYDTLAMMAPSPPHAYEAAAQAYERAIMLCGSSAERTHFQRQLDEMCKL